MPTTLNHIIMAATIGFFLLPTTNSALMAQDCSEGPTSSISIHDILPPCETITEIRTIWGWLVENPGTKIITGYRCLVEYTQIVMDWHGSSKLATPRGVEMVAKDVCLSAHKTKSMNLHGSLINVYLDGAVTHSVKIFNPKNQPWRLTNDYVYERTYIITLSLHTGTVDFAKDIVNFDLGVDCDFSSYGCEEDIGQIFWTPEINSGSDHKVIFSGNIILFKRNKISGSRGVYPIMLGSEPEITYAVMRGISKLIAIKVHPLNLFNETHLQVNNAFRADHPDWFIDVTNDVSDHKFIGNIYSESILGGSNDTLKNAIDIVKEWCQNEHKILNDRLNSHTIWGVEQLLELPLRSRAGFTNYPYLFNGMQVQICTLSYVTRRETEECFKDIPVRVKNRQNKNMFLNPTSRILVNHATPVPCVNQESQFAGHTDTVKVTLIVLVSLWGLAILMRLVKLIDRRVLKMSQNENQGQRSNSMFFETFYDVLKPPFAAKLPLKWTQNGMLKRLHEPTINNNGEAETELHELV